MQDRLGGGRAGEVSQPQGHIAGAVRPPPPPRAGSSGVSRQAQGDPHLPMSHGRVGIKSGLKEGHFLRRHPLPTLPNVQGQRHPVPSLPARAGQMCAARPAGAGGAVLGQ